VILVSITSKKKIIAQAFHATISMADAAAIEEAVAIPASADMG
jgi:hypothetical protein